VKKIRKRHTVGKNNTIILPNRYMKKMLKSRRRQEKKRRNRA